jgi:hypothetical protein
VERCAFHFLSFRRVDSAEHDGVANAQSESVAAMGMERHEIDDRAGADDVQWVDADERKRFWGPAASARGSYRTSGSTRAADRD